MENSTSPDQPKRRTPRPRGKKRPPNKTEAEKGLTKDGRVRWKSSFTWQIGETICELAAQGLYLNEVCRRVGIRYDKLYDWCQGHPDFAERLKAARKFGAECMLSEARGILIEVQGSQNGSEVSAANNLAQFMKWNASKLDRLQYGEHTTVDSNVKVTDERSSLRNKVLAQLDAGSEAQRDNEGEQGGAGYPGVGDEA